MAYTPRVIESGSDIRARADASAEVAIGAVGPSSHAAVSFGAAGTETISRSASGALSVDSATLAPTLGLLPNSAKKYIYAGDVAPLTTTSGTDTTPTAGTIYYAGLWIPANATLTGLAILNGSAVGTDKWIVSLYSSAGALVKSSALTGTTAVGTAAFQRVGFTATYAAVGPGFYFAAVSCNGNTARFRSHANGNHPTGSQAGVFGTLDAISSVPTTFTADVGPVISTY